MRRCGFGVGFMAAVVAVFQMGCVDWTSIRPTELPKLNGSSTRVVGQTGDTTIVAMTNIPVERPDGTMVTIRGEVRGARIVTPERTFAIDPPIVAQHAGPLLELRGGNIPPSTIELERVQRVEVATRNGAKSAVLGAGIGIIIGSIAAAVIATQI